MQDTFWLTWRPTKPNQPKSRILFHKKSSVQDFITVTLDRSKQPQLDIETYNIFITSKTKTISNST